MPIDNKISRTGLEFIKAWEGFRARAARRPDGSYVIGYGHTERARSGMEIDRQTAETLLLYDLRPVLDAISGEIHAPLQRRQIDALVSLVFNIGIGNWKRSGMIRHLNEGRVLEAASLFEVWRCARIEGEVMVVDALVRRRAAERALFLMLPSGVAPAPSAELHVVADPKAALGMPPQSPVTLGIDLEAETAGPREWSASSAGEPQEAAESTVQRLRQLIPVPTGRQVRDSEVVEAADVTTSQPAPDGQAMPPRAGTAARTLTEPAAPATDPGDEAGEGVLLGQRPGDLEVLAGERAREAAARFGELFDEKVARFRQTVEEWSLDPSDNGDLPLPPGRHERSFLQRIGSALFAVFAGLILVGGAGFELSRMGVEADGPMRLLYGAMLLGGLLIVGVGLYFIWSQRDRVRDAGEFRINENLF